MDIHFVSSLTPDDEERFAPALLTAVSNLLDQFPIAYTLRIETAGAKVFQHSHAAEEDEVVPSPTEATSSVMTPSDAARLLNTGIRTQAVR